MMILGPFSVAVSARANSETGTKTGNGWKVIRLASITYPMVSGDTAEIGDTNGPLNDTTGASIAKTAALRVRPWSIAIFAHGDRFSCTHGTELNLHYQAKKIIQRAVLTSKILGLAVQVVLRRRLCTPLAGLDTN